MRIAALTAGIAILTACQPPEIHADATTELPALELEGQSNAYVGYHAEYETSVGTSHTAWLHFELGLDVAEDLEVWIDGEHQATLASGRESATDAIWLELDCAEPQSCQADGVLELRWKGDAPVTIGGRVTASFTTQVPTARDVREAETESALELFVLEVTETATPLPAY